MPRGCFIFSLTSENFNPSVLPLPACCLRAHLTFLIRWPSVFLFLSTSICSICVGLFSSSPIYFWLSSLLILVSSFLLSLSPFRSFLFFLPLPLPLDVRFLQIASFPFRPCRRLTFPYVGPLFVPSLFLPLLQSHSCGHSLVFSVFSFVYASSSSPQMLLFNLPCLPPRDSGLRCSAFVCRNCRSIAAPAVPPLLLSPHCEVVD